MVGHDDMLCYESDIFLTYEPMGTPEDSNMFRYINGNSTETSYLLEH